FEWLELHDWENSVLAFLRRGRPAGEGGIIGCHLPPPVPPPHRPGGPPARVYPAGGHTHPPPSRGPAAGATGGSSAPPGAAPRGAPPPGRPGPRRSGSCSSRSNPRSPDRPAPASSRAALVFPGLVGWTILGMAQPTIPRGPGSWPGEGGLGSYP